MQSQPSSPKLFPELAPSVFEVLNNKLEREQKEQLEREENERLEREQLEREQNEKLEREQKESQQKEATKCIEDLQKIINANWNTHYINANADMILKSASKLSRLGTLLRLSKPVPSDADLQAASKRIKEKITFIGNHDFTLLNLEKYELFKKVADTFNAILKSTNQSRKSEVQLPDTLQIYINPTEDPSLLIQIPEQEEIEQKNITELSPRESNKVKEELSPKQTRQRRKRLPSPPTPPERTKKQKRNPEPIEKKEKSETITASTIRRSRRIAKKKNTNINEVD